VGAEHWARRASGLLVPRTRLAYRLWRFQPCTSCCPEGKETCENCEDDLAPNEFQVMLSGIIEDGCGDCDSLNDTYVVPWREVVGCRWYYYLPAEICNVATVEVQVMAPYLLLGYHINVYLMDASWTALCRWTKDYGVEKPDCDALNNEVIPLSWQGWTCDASSSTCLLTAL